MIFSTFIVALLSYVFIVAADSAKFILDIEFVDSSTDGAVSFPDSDSEADYNLNLDPDSETKLYIFKTDEQLTGYVNGSDYNLYDANDKKAIGIGRNYFSEKFETDAFYYPGDFSISDGYLNFNGSSIFHGVISSMLSSDVFAFGSNQATGYAKQYFDVKIKAVSVDDSSVTVGDFP